MVILVLWFALSNLDFITLRLWPLPFDLTISIAFLTLIQLFIGFLLGAIVTWIGDRHRRRENRLLNRRTAELEQSLAETRKQLDDAEKKLAEGRAVAVPTAA